MDIGEEIRRLRKEQGLKQYPLADKAGVHVRTIANYENHYVEPCMYVEWILEALGYELVIRPKEVSNGKSNY